jgi:PncC family amidohydrolase
MIQPDDRQSAERLHKAVLATHQLLEASNNTLVLAESCTAGLISASLARSPGISAFLAGSLVVYQVPSKVQWLGVSEDSIRREGVVSEVVAREMAAGALRHTPHATVALAITGHLGPDAPAHLDGTAWIAIAHRTAGGLATRLQLTASKAVPFPNLRWLRQHEAAEYSLLALTEWLRTH